MGSKKTPMRMCTGCREMQPKKELIRIVKTAEGEIKVDATGKLNGRGAYICKNVECLKKAQKTNALSRAFETSVSPEVYSQLETEIGSIE
ncbi:MAG: YlxR family protein [Clostridia bacterium]|nr:YlxR family protein [Clostridia bacterium]